MLAEDPIELPHRKMCNLKIHTRSDILHIPNSGNKICSQEQKTERQLVLYSQP